MDCVGDGLLSSSPIVWDWLCIWISWHDWCPGYWRLSAKVTQLPFQTFSTLWPTVGNSRTFWKVYDSSTGNHCYLLQPWYGEPCSSSPHTAVLASGLHTVTPERKSPRSWAGRMSSPSLSESEGQKDPTPAAVRPYVADAVTCSTKLSSWAQVLSLISIQGTHI